jgi:hypothetical protein
MSVINIAALQREAKNYQKDLRLLPYAILIETLKVIRVSLLEVDYKDTIIVKERKGGITAPYVPGTLANQSEISKLLESDLVTELAYCAVKDNITNYRAKKVLYDASAVNNKTKKHPLERTIIADIIKTAAEDVIDALFAARRDTSDASPTGMFDGYDTKISDAISAETVSSVHGNLVNSGNGIDDVGLGCPLAIGYVNLLTGAEGSVDTLKVNGVEQLTAPVDFITTLTLTAAAVVTNANANAASKYTFSSVAGKIKIVTDDNGLSEAGYDVTSTSTTITTSDENMVAESSSKAFDNLIAWLRHVDPKMKNKPLLLRVPNGVLLEVQDALENKLSLKAIEFENLLKHVQFRSGLPQLSIISHYCMGTGNRIHLTTPDNFDFGMNTLSDVDFVQVRDIYEDPNFAQFWMQFGIGTRIVSLNKKVFMTNEGTPVANSLSGDYTA